MGWQERSRSYRKRKRRRTRGGGGAKPRCGGKRQDSVFRRAFAIVPDHRARVCTVVMGCQRQTLAARALYTNTIILLLSPDPIGSRTRPEPALVASLRPSLTVSVPICPSFSFSSDFVIHFSSLPSVLYSI